MYNLYYGYIENVPLRKYALKYFKVQAYVECKLLSNCLGKNTMYMDRYVKGRPMTDRWQTDDR